MADKIIEKRTMRAALIYGIDNMEIGTVDIPEIKPNQVLIRIKACGVCPGDTRFYGGFQGTTPPPHLGELPVTSGHEWAGIIAQVGEEVKDWKIGDRVVGSGRKPCGMCYYCQHGLFNCCRSPENKLIGRGFSEYGIGVDGRLFRIPDNISFEEASFGEPLSCCIHGSKLANIQIGDDVVVIGVGPIGLMHVQLAKAAGARVIAVDRIASRLKVAADLGASITINPDQEDTIKKVKELTDGRGADAVILSVGAKPVAELGIKTVRIGGTVVFFATTYPDSEKYLSLDMNDLHVRQINLVGGRNYAPDDFRIALKYIYDGTVKVKPLISHYLPLEEVKRGFDISLGREGLKVMIQI